MQSQASNLQMSKKKKKRQRMEEKDAIMPPSPRPIVHPESIKVKVEVLYDRTDRSLPLLGYFPSGYEPKETDSFNVFRNDRKPIADEKKRGSEKVELVVKPSNVSNVEFVGSSHRGEGASVQLCTYALGVLNKENATLKIVPIAGNKILRLEPKVQRPDVTGASEVSEKEAGTQNIQEKLRELTRTYGTKKSQNQDRKKTALYRGTNPETMNDIDKTIESFRVNREALDGTNAHVAQNIPPHNISATTPQEAYPLEKIIFAGEWGFLEDIYQMIRNGGDFTESSYPSFVLNRVQKLKEIQDEEKQRTVAQVFSYITHLVKFKDMHTAEGIASAKKHRIPTILHQKFVSMFNPELDKWLTAEKRHLLTSYVLVLTLHLDEFRTKPDDISKDLRMSVLELRAIFEKLGCKFVRDGKSLLATLPLPLTFPQINLRKRKRGR